MSQRLLRSSWLMRLSKNIEAASADFQLSHVAHFLAFSILFLSRGKWILVLLAIWAICLLFFAAERSGYHCWFPRPTPESTKNGDVIAGETPRVVTRIFRGGCDLFQQLKLPSTESKRTDTASGRCSPWLILKARGSESLAHTFPTNHM